MKNKVIHDVVIASVHIQEDSTSIDSMSESTILCIELNVYAGVSVRVVVCFCVYTSPYQVIKTDHNHR